MATTKVDFDVLAHDRASDKLDRIARSFRKLSTESDSVKRSKGLDDLSVKLRKVSDDFDKEGNRSGKRFGSSLKKWVTGDGQGLFKQIGKDGGTVFGSGILGALKTPILGPALIAVVGGAVATAAPAVGAIAGAGIVSGFGAGLAGLGLVFAAKSDAVQKKWQTTMAQLGADMRLLSKPFEGTLISIAGIFQRTVDKFNPALSKAFQKSAGPIENFADQAGRALEKLVPAIAPITDAFNGVLDATGPALQDAVQSLSEGLIDLSHSIERNPEALADMTREVGAVTKDLLDFIGTMNDANGKFREMTGGTSLVTASFEAMRFVLGAITGPLALLAKTISGVSDTVNALKHDTDASGQSMLDAADKTTALARGIQATGGSAAHAAPQVKSIAERTKEAKQAAADAKQKFEDFISSLFRLQGLALSLSGAQIGLKAAVDAATASIKDNGKTLNINTEKGRANRSALNQVAEAANKQTEAMFRSGKGAVAASKSAEASRQSFVKVAMQMGLSKKQAEALARQLIAIPNVSRTAKLNANKKDLETKLAEAKRQLKDPNLTKERRAKLTAEVSRLEAGVRRAKWLLATVPTYKRVTIEYTTKGVITNAPSSVGRRAAGGPVKKGMPYIVGEHRPELFVPKQDGEIVPRLPRSAKGTALTTAPTPVAVSLKIESGGSRMDDLLVELLRRYVRVNGGNVQAVLGR